MEGKKPILLIEDSDEDVFFLKRAFRKVGVEHQIALARDGQEGIEYLRGDGPYADREKYPLPCLIITDLKMPRVDGFGLMAWIRGRSELQGVPLLVLSSSDQEQDRTQAAKLGGCAYYVKPSGIAELAEVVKHMNEAWIVEHCATS